MKMLDLTEEVGAIALPTLFISGEFDQCTPETARYYQRCIPGSELHIVADASHIANLERSDEMDEVVRTFIRKSD
jgi:pimeloyl-ACP methyl ester carboxylesterase